MLLEYGIDIHVGRLDYDGFLTLFEENPCRKIIDASHPFARIVSETVKKAAQTAGICMNDTREEIFSIIMKELFM